MPLDTGNRHQSHQDDRSKHHHIRDRVHVVEIKKERKKKQAESSSERNAQLKERRRETSPSRTVVGRG